MQIFNKEIGREISQGGENLQVLALLLKKIQNLVCVLRCCLMHCIRHTFISALLWLANIQAPACDAASGFPSK